MSIMTYDLTPRIFVGEEICSQCGHYTRASATIDTAVGLVHIEDNISCFGTQDLWGPVETFMSKFARDVSFFSDSDDHKSFVSEIKDLASSESFSDPAEAMRVRHSVHEEAEHHDSVDNAAFVLALVEEKNFPGSASMSFYDEGQVYDLNFPDDEIEEGIVGSIVVIQPYFAPEKFHKRDESRSFTVIKDDKGYHLEEGYSVKKRIRGNFASLREIYYHVQSIASRRGVFLEDMDFRS